MRSAEEIQRNVIDEIKLDPQIRIKVENGWIYLEGEADFEYERKAVEQAVENLQGEKGVVNQIKIKSRKVDWRGHLIN
ncbi:MAG: BON domain-containing protein [Cyclobacteriaceae bacterium]